MNRAFSPSLVRPNLPLRRPSSGPGLLLNRSPPPDPPGEPLRPRSPEVFAKASKKENDVMPAKDNSTLDGPLAAPVVVKLCNYCSQQGNLRCTRCKKTCYCSVACQTEDWKAHRHICKPCAPENTRECQSMPGKSGPNVLEYKKNSDVVKPKRVFLSDLRKNSISKGDKLPGTVVELKNPGKFFIYVQSVEMTETLRAISLELQKTYGSSQAAAYKPELEELCAVKFSFDKNWYRGQVESVDLDRLTAKVLYVDFGNEEDVTFDKIRSLAENIDPAPPCALQCCVAGVMPVTSTWTGECSIALRRLVAGKNLTFTVMDIMNSGMLLAVDAPLPALGKNLSTFLIDQGYAMKKSTPKPQTKEDINSLVTASFEIFKRLSDGKNENNKAQPPEPLTQGLGDTFTAIVTHLQSPSEIICQKLENASSIHQLQWSLREHCTKTPASENFRPAPGTVCCSLFSEDNQWYRAKVLAYSSEDQVCVGYIDFGNSEEVNLNNLRPISMDLLTLATQAIPCALAGIKPSSDSWSEEAILMLKRLVCNRFIQVEILGERDGIALVSMVDESSDPQTNVADILVTTGYAAMGNLETTNEMSKDIVSESTVAVNKLEWSCVELPIDGQEVVLVISVVEHPGEFYCYNYNAEDMQTLRELSSALMKHCEHERAPFSPVVGEPCCALFTGDGRWYRGMVKGMEDNGKARVYFVDFGSSCEVEVTNLRAIIPSLLKHSFQAIRCWLAGVEPVDGKWNKTAVQKFQALCEGSKLSGKVVSITEKGYGVELKCNGQNIAAVLISEQLARPLVERNKPPALENGENRLKEASPAQKPLPKQCPSNPEHSAKNIRQVASFPLDWKTVELPCGETFQPQAVAVTNPSLFYVMNPRKVNIEALQAVMTDVAKYCSRQAVLNQIVPLPGAACCAKFSGDKNWYRAVVLDTTSTHAEVLYADYGNCERIPISSILPIPKELLQHPFQIARCALSGNEHFPTVWPPEVLELFRVQLSSKVLTSVQGFDGTYNLLMFTQHSDQGGNNINSIILGALQKVTEKAGAEELAMETQAHTHGQCEAGSTSIETGHASSDAEKPKPGCEEMEKTETPMISGKNEELQVNTGSKAVSSVSPCCCDVLKQKIDRLEELILLLINRNGGNQK